MANTYTGHITQFTVREKSPRGTILFHIVTASPPGAPFPVGSFQEFKLDEDSEQSFSGMAAICARTVTPGPDPHTATVAIEVLSGANDEIDVIRIV